MCREIGRCDRARQSCPAPARGARRRRSGGGGKAPGGLVAWALWSRGGQAVPLPASGLPGRRCIPQWQIWRPDLYFDKHANSALFILLVPTKQAAGEHFRNQDGGDFFVYLFTICIVYQFCFCLIHLMFMTCEVIMLVGSQVYT